MLKRKIILLNIYAKTLQYLTKHIYAKTLEYLTKYLS